MAEGADTMKRLSSHCRVRDGHVYLYFKVRVRVRVGVRVRVS